MNESNDPAEQQPWEPDATTCFVEAAANLRVAEKLSSNRDYDIDVVSVVVNIAKVWTELGAALDNRQGWEGATPIPIRLIGDEDPQWAPPRAAQTHVWPSMGPTVCTRCGFGPSEVGIECMAAPHEHEWNPFSSVCQVSGCGLTREQRTAEDRPKTAPLTTPTRLEEHATVPGHDWAEDDGMCENHPCLAHQADAPQPCPSPAPHVHGPNCRHQWVHAAAPCANGCGSMPEGFYFGASGQPTEICPNSSCPVTLP